MEDKRFTLEDIRNYFANRKPDFECVEFASYYYERITGQRKLEVNMSSTYTQLIKEAGRCNRFSSDVIYDIQTMEDAWKSFDPEAEMPLFICGFRKDGVDGRSFVESRCNGSTRYSLYDGIGKYFAMYFVEVVPRDYEGSYNIVCKGYTC